MDSQLNSKKFVEVCYNVLTEILDLFIFLIKSICRFLIVRIDDKRSDIRPDKRRAGVPSIANGKIMGEVVTEEIIHNDLQNHINQLVIHSQQQCANEKSKQSFTINEAQRPSDIKADRHKKRPFAAKNSHEVLD